MRDDEYLLTDSRVTLASLVTCWKDGLSPESIRDEFPTLTLEQVYGAIAFYLHNQASIDADSIDGSLDFVNRLQQQANLYPEITLKLRSTLPAAKP